MRYHKHYLSSSVDQQGINWDIKIIKFDSYDDDIKRVVDQFNVEINWSEMYDLDEVRDRLSGNYTCYVLYNQSTPIGIVWFQVGVDTVLLKNLFISKHNRPKRLKKGINLFFLESVFCNLHTMGYQNCVSYSDEWNIKSHLTAVNLPSHVEISENEFKELTEGIRL